MPNIKYVFWDFGDTLVGLKPDILKIFIGIIFQGCGYKVERDDLEKAMRVEWRLRGQQDAWGEIKRVDTPELEHKYYADFFEDTLRRLKIDDCILPKLAAELATLKTTPSSYYVFPDALKIVNRLNKLRIRQAIISNGFHTAPKILAHSALRDKFEFEVWSYEHRTIKPERKIYDIALEQTGCQAEEAIFVDDRGQFVEAAKKLGMLAIQIDRSQHSNIDPEDQNDFPIINNLSGIEKYLHPERTIRRSKKERKNALEESNLQMTP